MLLYLKEENLKKENQIMFDMVKQKRRSILLIILFTILFLFFGYLNYAITYPIFMDAVGYEQTGFILFSWIGESLLWFFSIFFIAILFAPDVAFFILIIVNIRNYFKYSKMEKEHQR